MPFLELPSIGQKQPIPQVKCFEDVNLINLSGQINNFMRMHPKVLGVDVKQGKDPDHRLKLLYYAFILYVV